MKLAKLCRLLTLSTALVIAHTSAWAQVNTIEPANSKNYAAELKKRYGSSTERAALVSHVNHLLKQYALSSSYQVGQKDRFDLNYSIIVEKSGTITVREEKRYVTEDRLQVSQRNYNVFGASPFVKYECLSSGIKCDFFVPDSRQIFFSTLRDQQGAADIAQALTYLIRNIQKS